MKLFFVLKVIFYIAEKSGKLVRGTGIFAPPKPGAGKLMKGAE